MVVALLSVEEGVGSCGGGVKVVGTTDCHDACVVGYQGLVDAV